MVLEETTEMLNSLFQPVQHSYTRAKSGCRAALQCSAAARVLVTRSEYHAPPWDGISWPKGDLVVLELNSRKESEIALVQQNGLTEKGLWLLCLMLLTALGRGVFWGIPPLLPPYIFTVLSSLGSPSASWADLSWYLHHFALALFSHFSSQPFTWP